MMPEMMQKPQGAPPAGADRAEQGKCLAAIASLSPDELETLKGAGPEVLMVLAKLMPSVADVFEHMAQGEGEGDDMEGEGAVASAAPSGPMQRPAPPPVEEDDEEAPPMPMRPKTALGRM